jgi:hypothetical protein
MVGERELEQIPRDTQAGLAKVPKNKQDAMSCDLSVNGPVFAFSLPPFILRKA